MCNKTCIAFGISSLSFSDITGKRVLEVGSLNVNGSLRSIVEKLNPREYIGVDLTAGTGVDLICSAYDLLSKFGNESFDVVISTELLEHALHWQNVITNFKNVLKPGGIILLTTRSKGFPFHGYPFDFWRFEENDMRYIFSDMQINIIEKDPLAPGVFIKAHKPWAFSEKRLNGYPLFSVIKNRITEDVNITDITLYKIKYQLEQFLKKFLPHSIKKLIKNLILVNKYKKKILSPVLIEKSYEIKKHKVTKP